MDRFEFYQSILEAEKTRFKVLGEAVNAPITVLTLLSTIVYFVSSRISFIIPEIPDFLLVAFVITSFVIILFTLFYLALSFNNMFKGFKYPDLPVTAELYKYDNDAKEHNLTAAANDKIDFEEEVIKQYVQYSDEFAVINGSRAEHLYNAKTCIILLVFCNVIEIILLVIKNYMV